MKLTSIISSTFAGVVALSSTIHFTVQPTTAQTYPCFAIQDPDGWVNIRDRGTNEIVARLDNGMRITVSAVSGKYATLSPPHNQFIVHRSRVRRIRAGSLGCAGWVVVDPDGYVNLRKSPNGKILGRIREGNIVIIAGISTKNNNWVRILTSDGRTGFIHGSRLEVAN